IQMARSIARVALNGHYSIWREVFQDEPVVLEEIDKVYREIGLFKEYDNGKRIMRDGGRV
ncbi:MAG: hypothetical protein D3909_17805, partial [Candidatus Electrothrix sp. ATG1]|nr:hypothetical protein [Candidatus Electrothrix sp. ATG1]